MEFEEKLKEFIERIKKIKDSINTEEATKTSLIMPFFSLLDYDVFNPNEFIPEYVADVGIKKGEKVDYAIVLNNNVSILIEAKSVNENLDKYSSQLFRYFGTSTAKVAILTNGITYKFYTDLDETNRMDTIPFLEINLLNLKNNDITELKKFIKSNFDIDIITANASNLKYAKSIEKVLSDEFNNPSDEFVKLILNKGVYDGVKTQNVLDKYKPVVRKSISRYINLLINEKLKSALNPETTNNEEINDNGIITTDEELESYYIVKSILSEITNPDDIYYKDNINYFAILYQNKVTKWVCRMYFRENTKYVIIPDENKNEIKYEINSVSKIYRLKDKIIIRFKNL